MSATELWLLAAAITAGAATALHLLALPPWGRVANACVAAAIGLIAIALLIAYP